MAEARKPLSRQQGAALKKAVEEYERLTMDGRALTAAQIKRRADLLRAMREITGYTGKKSGLSQARKMITGDDPARQQARKGRYAAPAEMKPRNSFRPFDATRVVSVVSTAVESSRSKH